ncbi:MAG: aconitase X catalytic domain-containing protein [Candidatus Aenigmatarchaeota archaeon]
MMYLTHEEEAMLAGEHGEACKRAMEILVALGKIYGADRLINVASVQVAGVSYHNLGDAGLEFLSELARDGKVKVLTTLNPAGIDLERWKELNISEDFAIKQKMVIDAFEKLGIITSCTCIPYLVGNLPLKGQHIAWSESSAVTFANSVLGAKTNREGGPSALAAALTGKTANFGLHLDENRNAQIVVNVRTKIENEDWALLGFSIGKKTGNKIPFIRGIKTANLEELKSFSAAIATYGGTALFHIENITPNKTEIPNEKIDIEEIDLKNARDELNDEGEIDFVGIGCPHCSLQEIEKIAKLLDGKKVSVETWIFTARQIKTLAELQGWASKIEKSGAKIVCDTCMAVAPLKGRFKCLVTNSSKACFYGRGTNNFKTKFGTIEKCIDAAVTGKWK